MIIAISGTPGTGKTVVANLLGKRIDFKIVDLNSFAKKNKMVAGHDEKRDCDIVDIDDIDKHFKEIKENVVIESHFAHDIHSDVIVILRTNPKELRKRLGEREWKNEKIEENVLSEIMEVCLSEAMETGRKTITIDTTKKTPEETVDEIIEKLDSDIAVYLK